MKLRTYYVFRQADLPDSTTEAVAGPALSWSKADKLREELARTHYAPWELEIGSVTQEMEVGW